MFVDSRRKARAAAVCPLPLLSPADRSPGAVLLLVHGCKVSYTLLLIVHYYCVHLTAFFPGQPGYASTRKAEPFWKNQSGFTGARDSEWQWHQLGPCWAICKSAPCSRQITTPASHHSVLYRPHALPASPPTVLPAFTF